MYLSVGDVSIDTQLLSPQSPHECLAPLGGGASGELSRSFLEGH